MNSAQFHQLSLGLLGEPSLDAGRAEGLLQRFLPAADREDLDRLTVVADGLPLDPEEREKAIRSKIMADPDLRALAKTIIVLWYTGDLLGATASPPTEDQYFAALMWPVARAHPPGLSGGYFGHWAYPPDN
jgi:hypothetical protein